MNRPITGISIYLHRMRETLDAYPQNVLSNTSEFNFIVTGETPTNQKYIRTIVIIYE